MKKYFLRLKTIILPILLPTVMLLIIGPTEIFFANTLEFEFVFGDFFWYMLLITGLVGVVACLIALIPSEKIINIIAISATWLGIMTYLQNFLLNGNITLLGANPDGYHTTAKAQYINLTIWVVAFIVLIVILFKTQLKNTGKICCYIAAFLIAIQCIGVIPLMIKAEDDAYHESVGRYHISYDDELMLSSRDNIIIIILDWFSNQYVDRTEARYPGAFDCLNDFTYYDNYECNYFGTCPSMAHMLTGCEMDPSIPFNSWSHNIWENESTRSMYKRIKDKGYTVNLFTPQERLLVGNNNPVILKDYFDNVKISNTESSVDHISLVTQLVKASAYRYAPKCIKNRFYITDANMGIKYKASKFPSTANPDYYNRLCSEGLYIGTDDNLITITHIRGGHDPDTYPDASLNTNYDSDYEDRCRGCMTIVGEYLSQLRTMGKYDDSTIIITSDHGSQVEPQVIYFIKEKGESHEELVINHAPVSHCEFLSTIVYLADPDSADGSKTIYDYASDELRERKYWLRFLDDDYPMVTDYTGEKQSDNNVFYEYIYTGDFTQLHEKMELLPDNIYPRFDVN